MTWPIEVFVLDHLGVHDSDDEQVKFYFEQKYIKDRKLRKATCYLTMYGDEKTFVENLSKIFLDGNELRETMNMYKVVSDFSYSVEDFMKTDRTVEPVYEIKKYKRRGIFDYLYNMHTDISQINLTQFACFSQKEKNKKLQHIFKKYYEAITFFRQQVITGEMQGKTYLLEEIFLKKRLKNKKFKHDKLYKFIEHIFVKEYSDKILPINNAYFLFRLEKRSDGIYIIT